MTETDTTFTFATDATDAFTADTSFDDDSVSNTSATAPPPEPTAVVPFYMNFKGEPWVVPLVSLALFNVAAILVFEVYVLYKSCGGRRHLFLGQVLLLGLLFCSVLGLLYVPQPHWALCAATRAGAGLAYALVYGALLVKCLFLLKLHDGVYINASMQALVLFFAVGVEVAIVSQWMVYYPSILIPSPEIGDQETSVCGATPLEKIIYLSYVMFLLFLVVIASIRARGLRENNREALYIGISVGFCLVIWVAWTSVALIFERRFEAPAEAFGLTSTGLVVFLLIFIPKAVQLARRKGESGSTMGSPSILHTPSFLHLHANSVLPTSNQGTLVKQTNHVNADYCRGYPSRMWKYDYPNFQQMEPLGMNSEMNSLKKLNGSFYHSHLY